MGYPQTIFHVQNFGELIWNYPAPPNFTGQELEKGWDEKELKSKWVAEVGDC